MRFVKRLRSLLISLLALIIAISAGVATASVLLTGDANRTAGSDVLPGSQSAEARADDPRGGLPFGVMVWQNRAGQTCAALGHRVGDRITDPTGARDYPVQDGGGCVDLTSISGDLDVRRSGEHRLGEGSGLNPVTVIWGLAKPGIAEVQVSTPRGTRVSRVTPRGAFAVTFPGAVISELDIVAVTTDQVRRPTTFPGVPPEMRDRVLHPRTAEQVRLEMLQQEERFKVRTKPDDRG